MKTDGNDAKDKKSRYNRRHDIMQETLVITDDCIGCGKCVKMCIRGHLKVLEDKKVHEIDSP